MFVSILHYPPFTSLFLRPQKYDWLIYILWHVVPYKPSKYQEPLTKGCITSLEKWTVGTTAVKQNCWYHCCKNFKTHQLNVLSCDGDKLIMYCQQLSLVVGLLLQDMLVMTVQNFIAPAIMYGKISVACWCHFYDYLSWFWLFFVYFSVKVHYGSQAEYLNYWNTT